MNKIIYASVMLLLIFAVVNVYALNEDDELCSDKGFGLAASKWNYMNSTNSWVEGYDLYDINIVGGARKINWTSNVLIDGVIFKTSKTNTADGGYNGTIPKTTVSSDIQYVLFCKGEMEVPEYGLIGIMIVMVAIGLFLAKRK